MRPNICTPRVEWLPRLNGAPDDAEPRVRLMLAALLCGQGSDYVGGGLAQALSHAIGPRSSSSNGVVEALLLPYTMRYNAKVIETRLDRIARLLGVDRAAGASSANDAIKAVERILAAVGVPSRLRDVGVARDVLSDVVPHAMDDWALTGIPRPVTPDDLHQLLQTAW